MSEPLTNQRVRAVEHTTLAGLSRRDERAVPAWLATLTTMTTDSRQPNVD
jgi:hypothetical protein